MIIETVAKYLKSLNEEGIGDGFVHPSQIGGCIRANVLNGLGQPFKEQVPPRVRRIFHNGNDMHTRFQKYLRDLNLLKLCPHCGGKRCEICRYSGVEHRIEWPEYNVQGTCDGILKTDPICVLELKSINQNGFEWEGGISKQYIWQAHLYMMLLKIPQCLFIFENKNTQSVREILVKADGDISNQVIERLKEIKGYVEKRIAPAASCQNWKRRGCRFRNICKGEAEYVVG